MSTAQDDFQNILYERHGAVALISYNRPASRNAWTVPMVREVVSAVERANETSDVRVIVLTAEGSVYCAGADIKAPREPPDESGRSPTLASVTMGREERNWLKLLSTSKPVVAAVNGPAVGLGATHLLAADIRIAADTASFSFPFLKLGAMPECASTALLWRLVGFGRAMDICMRARTVSAAEALQIGLITSLHGADELRSAALEIAGQIASFSPLQVKLAKRLMWENAGEFDPERIMRKESDVFVELLRALGRDKPL